jgi:hypothetical protein
LSSCNRRDFISYTHIDGDQTLAPRVYCGLENAKSAEILEGYPELKLGGCVVRHHKQHSRLAALSPPGPLGPIGLKRRMHWRPKWVLCRVICTRRPH